MHIGKTVLRAISRDPGAGDHLSVLDHAREGSEFVTLLEAFPDFLDLVRHKRVVDFGCGTGQQAVALARDADCIVLGVDTNANTLREAREYARTQGVPEKSISFTERPEPGLVGSFDFVVSQNAMEHFPDPSGVLADMQRLLKPSGRILMTFADPWLSPGGSHMRFFCKVPWLNIWFSESSIMAVRALYRQDGATRYEDVESGLNKMTLRKFERIVRERGLATERRQYRCVKGLDFLARTPLREFFVNQVNCILAPVEPA